MKISNLYIGEIRKITDIEKVDFCNETFESKILGRKVNVMTNKAKNVDFGSNICQSKLVRRTLLLKSSDNSKVARDLIYGGKYKIGNFSVDKVGNTYAVNLNQYYLLRTLLESGYTKKHIGIFKLAKILKKRKNKLEVKNEKSIRI